MTAVVAGHFIDSYLSNSNAYKSLFIFIYAFHMPAFMYLAGMFHDNTNVRSRAVRLVIYGYLAKILTAVSLVIRDGKKPVFHMLSDSRLPWFMFVLAVFTVLSYLTRDLDKRKILVLAILIGCLAGYDSGIGDELYLSRIAVFYPFYIAGELTPKDTIRRLHTNMELRMICLAFLCLLLALCLIVPGGVYPFRTLLTGRNPYKSSDLLKVMGGFYRLGSYLLASLMTFSWLMVIPDRYLPFVTKAGTRTLQVYFWHYLILAILIRCGFKDAVCADLPGKILWILTAVLAACILSLDYAAIKTKLRVSFSGNNDRKLQ